MVGDDKGEGNGTGLSIGKEIDRSLAEIITSLLKPGATEVGNLLGDTIGLAADRMRWKRQLNAHIGLGEVRKKLEAANVDMKDITPPKEEELHLLISGLSLSDDENVRDMWAGLFAKALEPNSQVSAERPFISVLQSLSPMDAKVIDFLAFAARTDEDLQRNAKKIIPKDFAKVTAEEKEIIKKHQTENVGRLRAAIKLIEDREEKNNLSMFSDSAWAENLMRQGIIERPPLLDRNSSSLRMHSLDERELLRAIEHLNSKILYMEQSTKRGAAAPEKLFSKEKFGPQIQLEVQLSKFGRRFAEACGLLRDIAKGQHGG